MAKEKRTYRSPDSLQGDQIRWLRRVEQMLEDRGRQDLIKPLLAVFGLEPLAPQILEEDNTLIWGDTLDPPPRKRERDGDEPDD